MIAVLLFTSPCEKPEGKKPGERFLLGCLFHESSLRAGCSGSGLHDSIEAHCFLDHHDFWLALLVGTDVT